MTTWTTPRTWTNTDPTASQFNTDLRDNTSHLYERIFGYYGDPQTTDVTVANTTDETNLYLVNVAGNEMTATGLMRLDFQYYYSNTSGTSKNLTLKFYIGANSITIGGGASTITNGTTGYFMVHAWIRGDGTTSSQRCWFENIYYSGSGGAIYYGDYTFATDITTAQDFKLTAQWSGASAATTIICRFAGLTYNLAR